MNFIPDQSRPVLTAAANGAVGKQSTGRNWLTVGQKITGGKHVRWRRRDWDVRLRVGAPNVVSKNV